MATYTETVDGLKAKFGSFVLDAEAGAGNKSAALRSRKLSMELRKDFAEFRKASVANDQVNTKHREEKPAAPAAPTA